MKTFCSFTSTCAAARGHRNRKAPPDHPQPWARCSLSPSL